MGFVGVYRALYEYRPQAEGELAIDEHDLLYVLDNTGDDGWWKAKKRASAEDEDEPTGLVPHNYIEEAASIAHARTLFEYTRQTDEELSFPEDVVIQIFDTSDPDWILAGYDGEYGFVPSNYIDMQDDTGEDAAGDSPVSPPAPSLPTRPRPAAAEPESPVEDTYPASHAPNPAAAIAGVMHGRMPSHQASPPPQPARRPSARYEPQVSDDDHEDAGPTPALPTRPRPSANPSHDRDSHYGDTNRQPPPEDNYRTPGGFHMYNINEMVSVMGKRKKMPTTLGINLGTGMILIAPERAQDGPSQEWTADRMSHYSREGKHVFMELVRPSKSIDFHAGAKDTAEEIVSALGELAGAVRAEGLREVIMAGTKRSQPKGQILYDFMAQGDDEVTVAVGDEVIIVDDSKSEEWWQVRRLKNGKEGVVPRSYIEITGTMTPPPPSQGLSAAKSTVEQNRLEEIRLTKEAMKAGKEPQQVGPGMPLPERGSSLVAGENSRDNSKQQRSRRENGHGDRGGQSRSKSKPDGSKVRTWTDRSKSFSVDAQFLGLKDGKIHLHKMNGVKIAVPIAKMSREDLEYVENATGISLDDEKPLADVKRSKSTSAGRSTSQAGTSGASVDKSTGKSEKPEYDWFQFFLSCDIAVGLCQRYAQAFLKESMDESVLPDVDANILRNLGLREGDIIKVMRTLDAKFSRNRGTDKADGESGLFSGPGGTLRNNTRKGRPAPAVQTSDVVDAAAFSKKGSPAPQDNATRSPPPTSPGSSTEPQRATTTNGPDGFDDDAWDVKPSKQQRPSSTPKPEQPQGSAQNQQAKSSPVPPALTGSMQDLSLLSQPLEPTRTASQPQASNNAREIGQPAASGPPAIQSQPTGASPSFFTNLPQPQHGQSSSIGSSVSPQRQRPAPPPMSPTHTSLVAPPPQRPLSAPQSAQPSAYAPPSALAPQMTGYGQSQVAPPGQSLNEMTQARLQQQYYAQMQQQQQQQPLQPSMTGYPGMQPQGMASYPQGGPGQFMQPMMTGAPSQSPFADPGRTNQFSPIQSQPTGFQQGFVNSQPTYGQHTGPVNSYLPPAMEPQRTGMPALQSQATGAGGYNPNMQSNQPPQPLQPQKTGPAPPVRFGVTGEARKLTPQQTGRKANLAAATPQNPFGF